MTDTDLTNEDTHKQLAIEIQIACEALAYRR